jgi:hypothetical protein
MSFLRGCKCFFGEYFVDIVQDLQLSVIKGIGHGQGSGQVVGEVRAVFDGGGGGGE